MTRSRFNSFGLLVRIAASISLLGLSVMTNAQALSSPVVLEPMSPEEVGTDAVTVRNVYGKCGPAVVHVLGIRDEIGDFYAVDSAAENADIVVIGKGGNQKISLKRALSDYNGVACIGSGLNKLLLVWSDCGGSACGRGYNFTVVDVQTLRMLAGGASACDAPCAAKITGNQLPLELDK